MSAGGHGGNGISLPGYHTVHGIVGSSGSKAGISLPGNGLIGLFALCLVLFAAIAPAQSALNWELALLTGPVWMPILFGRFALSRFLQMRRSEFNLNNPFVLLEIRIPREVKKTPQAMETFFSNINIIPGEGTWLKKYWWGRTRPWWSFEIASFGGEVHFYVYTRVGMRRFIESSLYAQYPDIELIEAVDYSRLRDPSKPPYQMFACEYKHSKPDPYPIKTYVDFGLDKPGLKPDEVSDPFAQVIELFGSIGPEEQIWTQIMVRGSKGEKWRGKKNASGKAYSWRDEAQEIVSELRKKSVIANALGDAKQILENPTDVQKETVKSIERNVGKPGFDVGIRSIYSAPPEKWHGMNPFVSQMFKPYSSPLTNTLDPTGWSEWFMDYPWEDPGGKRKAGAMKEVVELFRYRSYFFPPYRGNWMTMSSEELATIFHIPSSIVKTPGLPRTPSSTASAPSNIPQ